MKTPNPLRDLIDDVMARNAWTLADVSTRARRAGHDLSPQNISRIKSGPVVNLVAKQVRALAAGLDLPTSAIIDANLRAMGFEPEATSLPDAARAVRTDPNLAARDRRVVLAVLRELQVEDGRPERPAPRPLASVPAATPGLDYDAVHDALDAGEYDDVPFAAGAVHENDGVEQQGPTADEDDWGR